MILIKRKNENLITTRDGLARYSIEELIMLASPLVAASYYNGFAAIVRALSGIIGAVLCEALARKLFGMKGSLKDLSAVTLGVMIALLLPASCPAWLPALGSAFGIAVAELPFGGARRTPFVPAAAGWCFLAVCFKEQVFTYAAFSVGTTPVYGSADFVSSQSLSQMLRLGKTINLNSFGADALLTGRVPGAMGTGCVLALLGVAVYLLIRRPKRLIPFGGFLAVCAVMALLFPRVQSGHLSSVVCELCAGNLLFVSLFILNEPVTCPKKKLDSLVYGALTGCICMLLSYFGKYDDNACFGVLIINAVWPALDDVRHYAVNARQQSAERKRQNVKKKKAVPAKAKFDAAFEQEDESEADLSDIRYEVIDLSEDTGAVELKFEKKKIETPDFIKPVAPPPDPERLRKIEEMFYKEIARPIGGKRPMPPREKAEFFPEEKEAPPPKKTEDAPPTFHRPEFNIRTYGSFGIDPDGEPVEEIDYTKYLTAIGEEDPDGKA